MSKKNKLKSGWEAYESKKQKKETYKWVSKHTYRTSNEITFFDKIIKFFILLSLKLTVSKKIFINPVKKKELVDTTYENLSSPKFNFIPAGLGLYLFFSMVPIFIIVISAIEWISNIPSFSGGKPLGWGEIFRNDILGKIIPGFDGLISSIKPDINNILFSATIILLLLSSIWFSSKGLVKFIDSQSTIYDHTNQTNFIIKRIRGIMMVPIISLFFIIALVSFIPLISYFKTIWPPTYTNNVANERWEYEVIFFISMLIFISLWSYIGVGILFRFSPLFKLKWKQIKPGILTTVIPMSVFTMIFGYLTSLIDYSKYGAIGTFLYAITFVLILSYFLYAGIIVNASYYKTFFSKKIISKKWALTNLFLEKIDIFKRKR